MRLIAIVVVLSAFVPVMGGMIFDEQEAFDVNLSNSDARVEHFEDSSIDPSLSITVTSGAFFPGGDGIIDGELNVVRDASSTRGGIIIKATPGTEPFAFVGLRVIIPDGGGIVEIFNEQTLETLAFLDESRQYFGVIQDDLSETFELGVSFTGESIAIDDVKFGTTLVPAPGSLAISLLLFIPAFAWGKKGIA